MTMPTVIKTITVIMKVDNNENETDDKCVAY